MDNIAIGKYAYFDAETGYFRIIAEVSELIYRDKELICSYSGNQEWANHFICELIDLFSGSSKFNYCLETTVHEKRLQELWRANCKEQIIGWINKSLNEQWFQKVINVFDYTIESIKDEAKNDTN